MKHSTILSKIIKLICSISIFLLFGNCDILQSLETEGSTETPDFFGNHSVELRDDILKTTQAIDLIDKSIRGSKYEGLVSKKYDNAKMGRVIGNKMEGPISERALEALPDLKKAEIRTKVENLFINVELENITISQQEREYWENFLTDLDKDT